MKKLNQICWQKYEDILESQVNSPLLERLYKAATNKLLNDLEDDLRNEDSVYNAGDDEDQTFFMLDKDFSTDIMLATSYECWIGHTNFNITRKIKNSLNEIEGVEVLKICSRYRFFIGIGRVFDFPDVRSNIERVLC